MGKPTISQWLTVVVTTTTVCVAGVVMYRRRHRPNSKIRKDLRQNLPRTLKAWRQPPGVHDSPEAMEALWRELRDFFQQRGLTLYVYSFLSTISAPDEAEITSTGFMYTTAFRAFLEGPGSVGRMLQYSCKNPLTRAARTVEGRDVIIRVLAIGSEGREHIDLLDVVARGPMSLISMNHTLPLLELIELDDIVFGVFPKVGASVNWAYDHWATPSSGDILDIITQCLEALVFLHPLGIAHRDVFKDNFLVQWLPETLTMAHTPPSKPRVYLIDFEVAVCFEEEVPQEERRSVGPPMGGSFPDFYGRPMPPEVHSGEPYDPFKLDVWQLGTTFSDFESTVPEIDAVLASMTDPNPTTRPTAYEAMKALLDAIATIPPCNLKIAPKTSHPMYR
ncbi:kinase-like domain-containing protein [Earliella scabrosa]|nr:kinase-like domain-containing protein [Earliella scabrosa]